MCLRGFYLDLESEGPSPVLRSQSELTEALRDLPQFTQESASALARFQERFCAWEDGRAAGRVVDAVFAEAANRLDVLGPGVQGLP